LKILRDGLFDTPAPGAETGGYRGEVDRTIVDSVALEAAEVALSSSAYC